MIAAQSLVWLALGGLLHIFGVGLWTIPATAWLVPLFMLRYSRKAPPHVYSVALLDQEAARGCSLSNFEVQSINLCGLMSIDNLFLIWLRNLVPGQSAACCIQPNGGRSHGKAQAYR